MLTSGEWKKVKDLTENDEIKMFKQNTKQNIKIKSIELLTETVQTGDIEVQDTHSYQLENGVVSHNSVLLGTASGIHGEHSPRYIRHVQMNKETEVGKLIEKTNPQMVETSVWSDLDYSIGFPIEPKKGSIYKNDLLGTKQLE